jgi:hypothetical protein
MKIDGQRPSSLGRRLGGVALLIACLAPPVVGQTVKEKLDLTRESVENQRRVLVSGALPLTDAETKAFWPLYDGYEKERRPLDERANKLVADFLAAAAGIDDSQARAMTVEALKIDEERARLRSVWYDRMAKAIAPRKLARLYQIENKLDSVVRADIARQIPLTP